MGKGRGAATLLPNGWPEGTTFLTQSLYSCNLTANQLNALRNRQWQAGGVPDEIPLNFRRGSCPLVQIRPITDPAHPAFKQLGLFAAKDLKPGSLIIPYLGKLHSGIGLDAEDAEKSDYDLWLCRAADVAIDAAQAGNEARFINDYRGVPRQRRQGPNAEFREVWDGRGPAGGGERGIAVFVTPATKKQIADGRGNDARIAKGEEILVNYGKGYWHSRGKDSSAS
jgi:xeroderma pigmentosum group C-complementing protein